MNTRSISFLLLGIFVILYLLPLGVRPLFIPDETRYAEVPREMIISGDWVVPHLNGLRYFEKPVLGYWISAVSLLVFGENNFAVRFPSSLACGFVALLIIVLCLAISGKDSFSPVLATLVYLTSFGVVSIGGIAVLDNVLTLFISACLIVFFLASQEQPRSRKERLLLFSAGLFAGAAFLTKGFVAFAVPVLTVAPYLVLQKRWSDCIRMLWLPLTGAVFISLPWAILIHMREPAFWHYFFWHEHIHRFFSETAQHREAFWFFIAILPALLIPWIFIIPSAIIGLRIKKWQNRSEFALFKFCLCWFVFPFLFFSVSNGKLITYILPCLPPVAILSGLGFGEIMIRSQSKVFNYGAGALCVFMAVILFGLLAVQIFAPVDIYPYRTMWKLLLVISAVSGMIVIMIFSIRCSQVLKKYVLFALAPVLLLFMASFTMPHETLERKALGPLLEEYVHLIDNNTLILSGDDVVRAACWYFKRENIFLVEKAGELQYGLAHDTSRILLNPTTAGDLVRRNLGNTLLVASPDEYKRWKQFFPKPVMIDSLGSKGYILLKY